MENSEKHSGKESKTIIIVENLTISSGNSSVGSTTAKNILDGGSAMILQENDANSTSQSLQGPLKGNDIEKSTTSDSKTNSKMNQSKPNKDDAQRSDDATGVIMNDVSTANFNGPITVHAGSQGLHKPVVNNRIEKPDVEVEKCDSKTNSKMNPSNLNKDDSQHSDNGDNNMAGASRLQTQTTVTNVLFGERCDSLAESSDLHINTTQVANLSKEANNEPGTSGLQTKPTEINLDGLSSINQEANLSENPSKVSVSVAKSSAPNPRKRKIKEEPSSEKSLQAKKRKKRQKARPTDDSGLEDFQNVAEQGLLKRKKVSPKSLKPHKLVETATIEVRRGGYPKSKQALEKAFKRMEHHSHPSAKELHDLATECKKGKKYFFACIFLLLSVRMLVKKTKSYKQVSDKLASVAKIVEMMLKEKKQRPDFSGGANYSRIAQVVADFMLFVCKKSFEKDTEHDVEQAGHKADALSWIAEVFLKTTLYKKAEMTAEEGKEIMDLAFSKNEKRSEKRYLTTVRLLSTLGYAYYKQKSNDQDAVKLLTEAVNIERAPVKRKENQQRASNTGTQNRSQKVDEKRETQRQTPDTDTQKNPREVEEEKEDQQQTLDTDAQKRPQVDMKKNESQRQTETQKRLQEVKIKIQAKKRQNKK